MTKRAVVYRFYDKNRSLLYVGCTLGIANRFSNHKSTKEWWPEVSDVHIEHFTNRPDALTAERKAIEEEKPRFNKIGDRTAIGIKRGSRPPSEWNLLRKAAAEPRRKKVRAMRAAGNGWKEIGEKFGITRQRAAQLGRSKP